MSKIREFVPCDNMRQSSASEPWLLKLKRLNNCKYNNTIKLKLHNRINSHIKQFSFSSLILTLL